MDPKKPMRAPQPNPYLVLAAAILLPGMGHVLLGKAQRGLGFAFFTLVGAWLTTKFASPDVDVIGRHAAGVFVWALSLDPRRLPDRAPACGDILWFHVTPDHFGILTHGLCGRSSGNGRPPSLEAGWTSSLRSNASARTPSFLHGRVSRFGAPDRLMCRAKEPTAQIPPSTIMSRIASPAIAQSVRCGIPVLDVNLVPT